MKFEILAPAGSMESLIAGVRSGANAVYLGGKSFNARRNAGNFDNEELKKADIHTDKVSPLLLPKYARHEQR